MSNITLNIVEPGSSTPIDPVVPNTGLFTSGIGSTEATIITVVSAVLILTIVAIVLAVLYKKHKKQNKATKLVSTVDACAAIVKNKKCVSAGLAAVALLVSACTFTVLLVNAGKSNTNAAEGKDGLTLDVSSEDFTIEVGDEPVFAVLPVELTVKEATPAGYTLTAYTDSTDLVSTTDSSKVIPMVTTSEGELAPITDNTYGLALDEKPTTKDAEVYMPLSTDSDEPTILKATDYVETEANDTTTIYYGFYITPDTPYGTYTGTDINYAVEPHYITNLSFDGNGSDGGVDMEGVTIIAGDTITLPENTYTKEGYNFIGWNTVAEPTEQDPGEAYEDQAEYTAVEGETKDVTLYAQWEEELPVIGDLTYMQDFATLSETEKTSVLNSMTEGTEYQLEDNRDQTMYYIAKLADGHVWMTQNLDLDLNNQTELTPENTNIKANWTPENSTLTIQGTSVPGWTNSDTKPYSADPGTLFIYSSGSTSNDDQYTTLSECQQQHSDCNMHNHAGNYYNWSAAVAMNDTSEYGDDDQFVNVETSICPAGWRLPKNRNAESSVEGNEQITQITSYDGILGEYIPYGPPGGFYNYLDGGFNAIRTNPLWLARSGGVYDGSLLATGIVGFYWSSTVYGSSYAYQLYFDLGNVDPAINNSRDYGYSVRCVAQ